MIEEEVPEVIPPPRIFNQTIFEEVGTENEPDQNTWCKFETYTSEYYLDKFSLSLEH